MASHEKVNAQAAPPHTPPVWHKLTAIWYRSHISRRSEYSVERLLSFRDYHKRTSTARVITICALSPIPALLVALLIDCIPLKPPSEGWRANYALWIRQCVAMFFEALGVVLQVREVIMTGTISNTGAATIALGTSISCVLLTIAVADAWKFPIPFGYVLLLSPYVFLFSTCMILVIGPRVLANSSLLRQQIKAQLFIIANQGVVAVCYPIYSAVFNHLAATQQAAFVFVMPIIKFLTKQNIANAAKNSHEYVGPIVVFSVDLFNVYYIAICMQSAKSMTTTLILIATDNAFVVIALRAIYTRANLLQVDNQSGKGGYLQDLLAQVRKVFQDAHDSKQRIRLLAPFPLRVSDESSAFMKMSSKTGRIANTIAAIRRISVKPPISQPMASITVQQKQHQVAPVGTDTAHGPKKLTLQSTAPRTSVALLSDIVAAKSRESVVHDALQTLFHSEYILLAKYIKLMVPILYSLYLCVLFHLPIAAYYPNTASMTMHDLKVTVETLMVYAAIEFVSFTTLLVLLWRKFKFSPLYQLAFVLETQGPALQGYLFVWTITILHLPLIHYGTLSSLGSGILIVLMSLMLLFCMKVSISIFGLPEDDHAKP